MIKASGAMQPMTVRRVLAVCGLLAVVLFGVVVISLRVGPYPISIREIVMTLVRGATGHRAEIPSDDWLIVFGLRLPRIALGIIVGAALSVAGASFQALLRNPLADPYVSAFPAARRWARSFPCCGRRMVE